MNIYNQAMKKKQKNCAWQFVIGSAPFWIIYFKNDATLPFLTTVIWGIKRVTFYILSSLDKIKTY